MFAAVDAGSRLWMRWLVALAPSAQAFYRWRPLWRVVARCSRSAPCVAVALALWAVLAWPILSSCSRSWRHPRRRTGWWRRTRRWPRGSCRRIAVVDRPPGGHGTDRGRGRRSRGGGPRGAKGRRRVRGSLLWKVLGAPFDAETPMAHVGATFWQAIRGAAPIAQPRAGDLSRRYSELLADSLGSRLSRAAGGRPRHGRPARPRVRAAR